jgi:hypothetical protein
MLFEIFERYNQRGRQRSIVEPNARNMNIPTTPMESVKLLPRGEEVEEEIKVDDTHPIEGQTEAEHKTRRIVLNELIEKIEKES